MWMSWILLRGFSWMWMSWILSALTSHTKLDGVQHIEFAAA